MYEGNCLCGTVKFVITGKISNIVHCHCSQCRKVQGTAFATNGIVKSSDFKILSGEDKLTGYASSANQTKYFCKVCGSPIISKSKSNPEEVRIRVGAISSDIEERPIAHIFVTSKANWEEINGDLPQYESYEPGRIK